MDGVLDFLVPEYVYKASIAKQWQSGDRLVGFMSVGTTLHQQRCSEV